MSANEKLRDIYDEIVDLGYLEDRREYDQEELQRSYQLTPIEADDLHWMIQRNFQEFNAVKLEDIPAEEFKEHFMEAQHNNWDGWDEEHIRLNFDRLLDDLKVAHLATREFGRRRILGKEED